MNNQFRILNLEEAYESKNISWPDVYYTPKYGSAVSNNKNIWECAIMGSGEIIYVYLKRPIIINGSVSYDLCSPYGYSGYYFESEQSINDFKHWFNEECEKRSYITEFICFNPYLFNGYKRLDYSLNRVRSTYSIVIRDYNDYFLSSSSVHRNMTRKGIKLDLQFSFSRVYGGDLGPNTEFRKLYAKTMDRHKASDFYYFDDEYFDKLSQINTYLATVKGAKGEIQAMSLFMVHENMMHYHLSCRGYHFLNCSQNYLFDNVVRWCLENGITLLHLGGGLRDGDSLSKFKLSISNMTHDYYYGSKIIDQSSYDTICEKVALENGLDIKELKNEHFFPVYQKYI